MAILELRVSMKSEKCEKKVKRYLTLVPGIDKLEADWRTQKVSVEGRADTKTVLKRLRKTGMVVELWPQHLYDPAHALYAPLSYDTVTTYDHDYGYEQRLIHMLSMSILQELAVGRTCRVVEITACYEYPISGPGLGCFTN